MDAPKSKYKEDLEGLSGAFPVISEYAKRLEKHIKRRYLQKISVIGVDPAIILSDQFGPECLSPAEATDLLSYLVLDTSYYTKEQFKAYQSLEAYNQMTSGFVASVQGKLSSEKYVVVGKVCRSCKSATFPKDE